MAKERMQKQQRSNKSSKDGGHAKGKKGGGAEKKVSIGKRIRDIKRLLSKPDLDDAIRRAQENRLAELLKEAEERKQQERERKLSIKYHKVRFFERVKIERKIKKLKAKQKNASLTSTEQSHLEQLEDDLLYVLHFPKGERYVSLLINSDDPSAQAHIVAERARLRALVKEQMAEEALLAEADEGKSLLRQTGITKNSKNEKGGFSGGDGKFDKKKESKKGFDSDDKDEDDDNDDDDDFFLNDGDDEDEQEDGSSDDENNDNDSMDDSDEEEQDDDDVSDSDDDIDDDNSSEDDDEMPIQPKRKQQQQPSIKKGKKPHHHYDDKKKPAFKRNNRNNNDTNTKSPKLVIKKPSIKKPVNKNKKAPAEKQPIRKRAEGGRKRRSKKKD